MVDVRDESERFAGLGLPAGFDVDTLLDEVDRQFVESIYLLVG
jgi:hypothetical protein